MSQNTVNGLVLVKNKKKGGMAALAAALTFGVATSGAHAAMDMTETVTAISAQTANVETIGIAILGVLVVIAGIGLLRRVVR
ncbi:MULTISPECIES: major capsid protein [unclassified Psychrobacter]|uniref:major capsid protein n=1 Tax=unclassified Psychrobacter TaxID=196806 RepID=UPI0025B4D357|nr:MULTISPECIES: major capsid protein [unclassified Psychrobacter]MDN3452258.1 major capsid protein [Psychrobacter sp. APC 3350]MDN3502125.1 major capsid protein [Psychrobacter sp. 5A.1]